MTDSNELHISLTPKQYEVYKAFNDDEILELLIGGWWRWGKTRWVCEIIKATCVVFPGISWLVGRRERDDLRKTTLISLLDALRHDGMQEGKHFSLNLQSKELTFWNGSNIFFTPLQERPTDPEFNWLGGYEITFAFVDEAQEVKRKAINIIKSRLTKMVKEYNLTWKVIMGCNPMKWHLYQDFIKPQNEGTIPSFRKFIQILYKDNPYIDHKKYEESLRDADLVTKERLLHGSWEYDNTPWRLYAYDDLVDMRTNPITTGETYLICDPARLWEDRAVEMVWYGREIREIKVFEKCLLTDLEDDLKRQAQTHHINMSRMLVDADGLGAGIPDHLGCKGFQNWSAPIPTSDQVKQGIKPIFENLKTQCYFELQKHIRKISINDTRRKDLIIQELDVMSQVDLDKEGKVKIISKEKVKEKIWRSPNFADCMAMRCRFELQQQADRSDFSFYVKGGW